MEYRLLIDIEAIEVLDRLPKRVRQQVLGQLHKDSVPSRVIIQITTNEMPSGVVWKSVSFPAGQFITGSILPIAT